MKAVLIDDERLARAELRLLLTDSGSSPEPSGEEDRLSRESRFFVKDGDRCWFVAVNSLYLIEGEGNYSRLYFGQEQALIYRSLSSLEKRLPTDLFLRANRSQVINCDYVTGLEPWFSQTLRAKLKDGHCIEFSRRASLVFRERMSL